MQAYIYDESFSVWVRYGDGEWAQVGDARDTRSQIMRHWHDFTGQLKAGNGADYQIRHYYRDKEHGAGYEVIEDTLASERNV